MNFIKFTILLALVNEFVDGRRSKPKNLPSNHFLEREARHVKVVRSNVLPKKICNAKVCNKCSKVLSFNLDGQSKAFCERLLRLPGCCDIKRWTDLFRWKNEIDISNIYEKVNEWFLSSRYPLIKVFTTIIMKTKSGSPKTNGLIIACFFVKLLGKPICHERFWIRKLVFRG